MRLRSTSEGPLDNPADKVVIHAGAAVRTGETARGTATWGVFERVDDETAWNAEFAIRFFRCFGTAEYFRMTDERKNPVAASRVRTSGWHAQLGVMAVAKRLELAARYATIDPDRDASDAQITEMRLAATWFLSGHALKVQADAGRIEFGAGFGALSPLARRNLPALGTRLDGAKDYSDDQYRLQVQLVFWAVPLPVPSGKAGVRGLVLETRPPKGDVCFRSRAAARVAG